MDSGAPAPIAADADGGGGSRKRARRAGAADAAGAAGDRTVELRVQVLRAQLHSGFVDVLYVVCTDAAGSGGGHGAVPVASTVRERLAILGIAPSTALVVRGLYPPSCGRTIVSTHTVRARPPARAATVVRLRVRVSRDVRGVALGVDWPHWSAVE